MNSLRCVFFKIWKGTLFLFLLVFAISRMYFSFDSEEKSNINDEPIFTYRDSISSNKNQILSQFYHIPLYFEKNEGQIHKQFKYLTRCPGHVLYFAPNEVFVSLKKSKKEGMFGALNIQFVNANPNPVIQGIDEQECKSNYFIGNDPTQWHRAIPNYAKISYQNLYPGIDAIFYGNAKQLEYDFHIAPGVNPNHVRMHLEGAKHLAVDHEGNLEVMMEDEQIVQMKKPLIFQELAGNKVYIPGEFVLLAANDVGFVVNDYDTSKELVIDPILTYSSYLGGSGDDQGFDIVIDSQGNAYVTGSTESSDFPTTAGVFQSELAVGATQNAFVTKFNSLGTALVYSTYLGGGGFDAGNAIAVNSDGQAYITGETSSADFPITAGAFQSIPASVGQNGFVTQLNSSGSDLIYSTFLGGNGLINRCTGIAIDVGGNAYVTGNTTSINFPTTSEAFQTTTAASISGFATKLNSNGTNLIYSTYLRAEAGTQSGGLGITIDSAGYAYVTGFTDGENFPTTIGAFQTIPGSGVGIDAFITKLNQSGTGLIYSTYLGGNAQDFATSIAIDEEGNAYVAGQTSSSNFPVTEGAFQTTFPISSTQAFVTKLNSTGTALYYSTFLGGSIENSALDIKIDGDGHAYVVGSTTSPDFPITMNAIQTTMLGIETGFITKFNSMGSDLLYSTYFGGATATNNEMRAVALDVKNNAYVTGFTDATDFPTTSGAFQTEHGGALDAFVAQLAIGAPTVTTVSPQVGPVTGGTAVIITGTNLGNITAVFFGETPASTFTIDSDTQITAVSPPHSLGVVDITVVGVGTSEMTTADQFTYILTSTSTILTVLPNPATVGELVIMRASIASSSATGSVTFFDGTKLLSVETLSDGIATFTTRSLSGGKHSIVASYSGDNVYLGSVSSVVLLDVKPAAIPLSPVSPPRKLRGFQKIERFGRRVNIVRWEAPLNGNFPVAYEVYRDEHLNHLIERISSEKSELKFKERVQNKEKVFTYYLVSLDKLGNRSLPRAVTIK